MHEPNGKTEVFLAMWLTTLGTLDDLADFLATDATVVERVTADLVAGADAVGIAARMFGAIADCKHLTTEPYSRFPGAVGGVGPDVVIVKPADAGDGWDVFAGMPSMPMASYEQAAATIANIHADSGRRWIAVERDQCLSMLLSAAGGA